MNPIRQMRLTGGEMRALSDDTCGFLVGNKVECDVEGCRRAPTHAIRLCHEIAPGVDLPGVSFACLDHTQKTALAGNLPLSEGA